MLEHFHKLDEPKVADSTRAILSTESASMRETAPFAKTTADRVLQDLGFPEVNVSSAKTSKDTANAQPAKKESDDDWRERRRQEEADDEERAARRAREAEQSPSTSDQRPNQLHDGDTVWGGAEGYGTVKNGHIYFDNGAQGYITPDHSDGTAPPQVQIETRPLEPFVPPTYPDQSS